MFMCQCVCVCVCVCECVSVCVCVCVCVYTYEYVSCVHTYISTKTQGQKINKNHRNFFLLKMTPLL